MTILILLVSFVFILVLGTKLSMNLMGRLLGRNVSDRHHDAEYIVNTGRVPVGWIRSAEKKQVYALLHSTGFEDWAKENTLERLDGMIRYFEKCPYLTDEDARKILVEELAKSGELWRDMSWPELRG